MGYTYTNSSTIRSLPQIEQRLATFENSLPNIKFPITLNEFIKDKELKARVDKFNEKHRTSENEIKLEPLYYLTLYIYNIVDESGFNGIVTAPTGYSQFIEAMFIASRKGAEATFKVGKEKIVITDRDLLDFIFNIERIALTVKDKDIRMLHTSKITEINARRFSYTDASSYFVGLLFEYFEEVNLSKGIIAYLLYLTGWVSNESILLNNDYIKSLWSTYKRIKLVEKKSLHISIYA